MYDDVDDDDEDDDDDDDGDDDDDDEEEEEKRTCEKKGGGYGIQAGITNKNHHKTIFIFCEDVRIVHHGLCRRHWWGNGTLRRLARCQGCRWRVQRTSPAVRSMTLSVDA